MDERRLEEYAATIAARLPDWSKEAAFLGLRAGFRCEYCSRNLLTSVEDYDAWQNDHVLPRSRGGSEDLMINGALACKTCNFIKRHTKPVWAHASKSRDELVRLYGELIAERRQKKQVKLDNIRDLLAQLGLQVEDPA